MGFPQAQELARARGKEFPEAPGPARVGHKLHPAQQGVLLVAEPVRQGPRQQLHHRAQPGRPPKRHRQHRHVHRKRAHRRARGAKQAVKRRRVGEKRLELLLHRVSVMKRRQAKRGGDRHRKPLRAPRQAKESPLVSKENRRNKDRQNLALRRDRRSSARQARYDFDLKDYSVDGGGGNQRSVTKVTKLKIAASS